MVIVCHLQPIVYAHGLWSTVYGHSLQCIESIVCSIWSWYIIYSVQSLQSAVYSTWSGLQSIVQSLQYIVYRLQLVVYGHSLDSTIYKLQSIVYGLQSIVYSLMSIAQSLQSAVYSLWSWSVVYNQALVCTIVYRLQNLDPHHGLQTVDDLLSIRSRDYRL